MSSSSAAAVNANNVDAFLRANPFLGSFIEDLELHMDTIPNGGVAGEEEYEDWGKTFVKLLVRRIFIVFFALLMPLTGFH
jgi:hypothetical protein